MDELTLTEAAQALGITEATLCREVQRGHIAARKKTMAPNSGFLFTPEEIERYKLATRVHPTGGWPR